MNRYRVHCSVYVLIAQVMDVIAPPYSQEFVDIMYPLINNEDITGSLRNDQQTDPASAFLSKFCYLLEIFVSSDFFVESYNDLIV